MTLTYLSVLPWPASGCVLHPLAKDALELVTIRDELPIGRIHRAPGLAVMTSGTGPTASPTCRSARRAWKGLKAELSHDQIQKARVIAGAPSTTPISSKCRTACD